jgi:hypothetical protein
MTAIEPHSDPLPVPTASGVRWRLFVLVGLTVVVLVAVVSWVLDATVVDRWLAVHAGTDDLSGSWYGFWSGIGSDLAEIGLIGAVATGVYQIVRKYNCHEPRCWRVGTHPAAGGQFLLCYRHHPDYGGRRPTHELIEQLHRDHLARTSALHDRLEELHGDLAGRARPESVAGASDRSGTGGERAPT